MIKIVLGSTVLASLIFAADLQTSGVEVTYKNSKDENKTVTIKKRKKRRV